MVWLLWRHGLVDGEPVGWRGESPSAAPRDVIPGHLLYEGLVTEMEGVTTTLDDPLQGLGFFGAQVSAIELWFTGVNLSVRWSVDGPGLAYGLRARPRQVTAAAPCSASRLSRTRSRRRSEPMIGTAICWSTWWGDEPPEI